MGVKDKGDIYEGLLKKNAEDTKSGAGRYFTPSSFSKEALTYARKNETKIVLLDGVQLAQLMIDYNLGISVQRAYEIKRLDNDYFEECIFLSMQTTNSCDIDHQFL